MLKCEAGLDNLWPLRGWLRSELFGVETCVDVTVPMPCSGTGEGLGIARQLSVAKAGGDGVHGWSRAAGCSWDEALSRRRSCTVHLCI